MNKKIKNMLMLTFLLLNVGISPAIAVAETVKTNSESEIVKNFDESQQAKIADFVAETNKIGPLLAGPKVESTITKNTLTKDSEEATGESQNSNDSPVTKEMPKITKSDVKEIADYNVAKSFFETYKKRLDLVDTEAELKEAYKIKAMYELLGQPYLRALRASWQVDVPFSPTIANSDTMWTRADGTKSHQVGWYNKRVSNLVALCIELGVPLIEGANPNYEQKLKDTPLLKRMSLIFYYGYEVQAHNDVNEMKTQWVSWLEQGNKLDKINQAPFTAAEFEVYRKDVIKKVDDFFVRPSFEDKTVTLKIGESIKLTDSKGVFSNYLANADENTANVDYKHDGNTLTITGKKESKENGVLSFDHSLPMSYRGVPLVYENPYTQNTFIGKVNDPTFVEIPIKVIKEGDVEGVKIDEQTKLPMAGVKFTGQIKGGESKEFITDSQGKFVWKNILDGSEVTFNEIETINGYVINKTPQSAVIVASETKKLTFTNKKQVGSAIIVKNDSVTGKIVQGEAIFDNAIYGLHQTDGKLIKSVTLKNVNGKVQAQIDDLNLGDYYWLEEVAPIGYQLNPNKIHFTIEYAGQYVEKTETEILAKDDVIKGGFDLIKFGNYDWKTNAWNWVTGKDTSEETKKGLEGVEFSVYRDYGDKTKVLSKKTNETGYVSFKNELPFGTYRVSETGVPMGYKGVKDFYVTVSEHGENFHYAIENKVKESVVIVSKIDSESGKNIPLPEAGFEIYSDTTKEQLILKDSNDEKQSVFFTNEEGVLQVPTMFAFGGYSLKEVQAPTGYVLSEEIVKFTVTGDEKDGIVKILFKNRVQKGGINLHKNVQTATGLIEKESEHGKYKEIEYTQESAEGFKFKIMTDEVIKTPEGTVKQEKDTFIKENDEELILITDAEGNVESDPVLYQGSYKLVEVYAPAGVIMLKEPQPFEITYAGQLVEITSTTVNVDNDVQKIRVTGYKNQEVVKGFEDGEAVIDVLPATNKQLFVLKNNDELIVGENVLEANSILGYSEVEEGEFYFEGYLPKGKYYFEEVNAGIDHLLLTEKYEFDYNPIDNEESQMIHVWADSVAINKEAMTRIVRNPILNKLARQAVKLVKVDTETAKEETLLAGVKFNLVSLIEAVGVTDLDDEIEEETEESGASEAIIETVDSTEIENLEEKEATTKVEIEEIVIGEYLTDENGEITVENLPTGSYKFIETEPLIGYLANEDDLSFEVKPETDGELIELKAINKRKTSELGTLATGINGEKDFDSTIENSVIDKVSFKWFIPNEKYKRVTQLIEKGKTEKDDKIILNQEEVVEIKEMSGEDVVKMTIAANTLDPSKDYYFAEFYSRETDIDTIFAEHNDRDAESQTIKTKRVITLLPQTGEEVMSWLAVMGIGLILFVIASGYTKRQREDGLV